MRRLRIAIATVGRYHVLDLARELSVLGHDVAFWTIVPRRMAVRFGLPPAAHRGLLPALFPLVAVQRYGGCAIHRMVTPILLSAIDSLIARKLEPCDVFIGMSGLCIKSAVVAKQRFEAKVFIERGSRHILSQKEILDAIASPSGRRDTVPAYAVRRELASYDAADVIVVPSKHVVQSFLERGVPESKLFRNPYGVDLSMFPVTPAPPSDPPTVLCVGAWSLRKGCDVLTEAWRMMNGVRLLHVGPLGDAPLPQDSGFEHHDPVPQWRLREFYAQAHVFVLASREDGFGLVLSQALACGLPVVCTDRTGGEDLREFLDDPSWVTVVPVENPGALADGIRRALDLALGQPGVRNILGDGREKPSWRAYGARYDRFIRAQLRVATP